MIKVITYGSFDVIHYGHIRLLERAKALGDYLIVGVSSDDFDKVRGKINLQQSLTERIEGVKNTGLADKIIVMEYEGQKIDDVIRFNIDILVAGSDWVGKFDYVKPYCQVVYLERTQGISSTQVRQQNPLQIGIVGESPFIFKVIEESCSVNGIKIAGLHTQAKDIFSEKLTCPLTMYESYEQMLDDINAVYIVSHPTQHSMQIRQAIENGKHVLCESPIALNKVECKELYALAQEKQCILHEALRTAYLTAYHRLVLLAKAGKIGKILSVDVTCTSLAKLEQKYNLADQYVWNGMSSWGPTAMLPVFQILGTDYVDKRISVAWQDKTRHLDKFTHVEFYYPQAVASIKVGKGAKSEGSLVISGTKGYIYVPAPWWKTNYFEVRYENPNDNLRYFYQLNGEGICYEMVSFLHSIRNHTFNDCITEDVSSNISSILCDFETENNIFELQC